MADFGALRPDGPPGDSPFESSAEAIDLTVESRAHGWRVDHYLARLFPNFSRELFKRAIADGGVLVNGLPVKASRRLRVNDRVSVRLPAQPDSSLPADDIPLDVIHEDDAIVVLNKPPGLIVHPGKGNYRGTLAGALQFHFDQLSDVAGTLRPGIVHRLDRDTSGVMVVAKNNQVHDRLTRQFERREIEKEYRAIVHGRIELDSDFIETHVQIDRRQREKMRVCGPGGNAREAVTFYDVLERFPAHTYVRLLPKTGRTHQLRLHMQHLGHAIVADRLYGGAVPPAVSGDVLIGRQALHAFRLRFVHPQSRQPMQFEAPLPADIQRLLDHLQRN